MQPASQLVCACSEDAARDAVWASSLVRVNTFKCFTHVLLMLVKESPQVLVADRVGGTVLSSKRAKKLLSFVWEQDIGVRDGPIFLS